MAGGSHKTRLAWVGGEHEFCLNLGQLRGLQNATDAGPEQLLRRMANGEWRVDDVVETVRWGLIGGGMSSKEAGALVVRLYDLHPVIGFRELAYRILGAALIGVEDDPVGEPRPAPESSGNGNSPDTTEPGQ